MNIAEQQIAALVPPYRALRRPVWSAKAACQLLDRLRNVDDLRKFRSGSTAWRLSRGMTIRSVSAQDSCVTQRNRSNGHEATQVA
jgi:hypothetical protein